jgi:hypothetical protein
MELSMCRSDIASTARPLLGRILGDMAQRLADEHGVLASEVVIGPVDFGDDHEARP